MPRDPRLPERLAAYADAAAREEMFRDKPAKYSSYGACRDCPVLDDCPISIGHVPNSTDASRIPDFPCAFYRVALGYRERFPTQSSPIDPRRAPPRPAWPV